MSQIIHDVSFPNDGLGDPLRTAFIHQNEMNTELYENKVDKVVGKDLSSNDYTDIEKSKLAGIEYGAQVNVPILYNDIIGAPTTYVSSPYKSNFPHVDSNVFIIPEGVAVLDVRPCGAGSFIGWTQLGTTLTFEDYTLESGDYLIVIGIYNDANIYSPIVGGSVYTDGVTITGDGTILNPLVAVGGGGGGAVDSVNGKTGVVVLNTSDVSDTTNKRYVTDSEKTAIADISNKSPKNNPTFTGSVVIPNAVNANEAMALGQYTAVVQATSFTEVYSANKTLTPLENQKTIFMDSGTLTINPNTQTYQDGYAVAVKSSGVANTPLVLTAATDWTYQINGATAVASGSLFIENGYTCTIIKKATLKIFSIDGSVI